VNTNFDNQPSESSGRFLVGVRGPRTLFIFFWFLMPLFYLFPDWGFTWLRGLAVFTFTGLGLIYVYVVEDIVGKVWTENASARTKGLTVFWVIFVGIVVPGALVGASHL
jgi:hypothetical protein